jgi:hypothetical protein
VDFYVDRLYVLIGENLVEWLVGSANPSGHNLIDKCNYFAAILIEIGFQFCWRRIKNKYPNLKNSRNSNQVLDSDFQTC